MEKLTRFGKFLVRCGYLARATAWAVCLGIIETVQSSRGRRVLGGLTVVGAAVGFGLAHPVRAISPGEVGIRTNRVTGGLAQMREGWALMLPGLHGIHMYSLRDQIYRPEESKKANGSSAYQSVEGLSLGADVSVRYALDPEKIDAIARRLPEDVGRELVEPVVDGVVHRVFSKHTVREIFSTKRAEIQETITTDLRALLAADGIVVRAAFLGNIDLPAEYKEGLESLLTEELSSEKMRYTLELKDKMVKQSELEAKADKVKRETAAEAAGQEEIIAAKAKAEAMKHVLPFKEKEIEQRRLEAEAAKITRMKQAEGEAEARKIESLGEAESRRTLASADAFRIEAMGKASSANMERDSALIAKNPLLIQKTLADKLSDKIQVIVAPPSAGGFFAGGLLGQRAMASEGKQQKSESTETEGE